MAAYPANIGSGDIRLLCQSGRIDDQLSGTAALRRNRNFALLWVGQALSDTGGAASALAYPLLVLAVTHSPALAGVVGTVAAVLGVAGRLPAGALVDRLDRRLVMLGCDGVRLAVVASLAIVAATGHAGWPVVMVVACVDAVGGAVFDAASYAVMPMVLDDGQLEGGWAAVQGRGQVSSIVGPPAGGAMYDVARWLPFVADAASYAVSLVTITAMRGRFSAQRDAAVENSAPSMRMHHDVGAAFGYVWRTPLLRGFVLQAPLLNFAYAGVVFTVPVALRIDGVRAAVIGVVLISLSVGPLVGSALSTSIGRRVRLPLLVVVAPVSSTVLFTVAAVLVPSPLIALPLACVGLLAPALNVVLMGRIARSVPEHLMGRVFSVLQFCGGAFSAAAPVVAGLLVAHANGHAAIAVFAAADLVAVLVTLRFRHVWAGGDVVSRPR